MICFFSSSFFKGMDFDVKTFLPKSSRVKEDVKTYMKSLAENMIRSLISICTSFTSEKISLQHVKFALFTMCVDPIVMYNRMGLTIQNSKFKCMTRTLIRQLENEDPDDKYAGIDKKFFKSTASYVESLTTQKLEAKALRAIAFFAHQVCGIILNSAIEQLSDRTLTLESIDKYGTTHVVHSEDCINSSLVRMLHFIQKGHWVNSIWNGSSEIHSGLTDPGKLSSNVTQETKTQTKKKKTKEEDTTQPKKCQKNGD